MARSDFGAHVYWRVYGTENGIRTGFTAYSAMAFKDASGSAVAATGGSAIESDHHSTFAASALFDGTDATFWESANALISWAGYQFGSAVTVMQIGLQKHSSMDGSTPGTMVTFECSDDGVTWYPIVTADPLAIITSNDTMFYFNFAVAL